MVIDFLLDWAGLTVSFFITICLLWLGLMILLAGNRKSTGAWVTIFGFLLASLFFTSHTAILGRGLAETGFGMDFWWWVSWTPSVIAPLAWYGATLWYSGFRIERYHPHHFGLVVSIGMAVLVSLLIVFANPIPAYRYVVGQILILTPSILGIPILIPAYLVYCFLCFLLPLDLIRNPAGRFIPNHPTSLNSVNFMKARPWLAAASVCLLLSTVIMTWTAMWVLKSSHFPSLSIPADLRIIKTFDLSVEVLVAFAITFLGRAVVGYEVFTARPLPRLGFFTHWRATVLLAGGFSAIIGWSVTIQLRPIYSLMLTIALMTLVYALYSWRAISERAQLIEHLRPFIASQDLLRRMIEAEEIDNSKGDWNNQQAFNQATYDPFQSLCQEVLNTTWAVLIPSPSLATLVGSPIHFPVSDGSSSKANPLPPFSELVGLFISPTFQPAHWTNPKGSSGGHSNAWLVPLLNGHSLSGILALGEKNGGNPYTEEEIQIGQSGGERILDTLAGAEMARLSMNLLRQRISQIRVLDGQGRRILHDEVLPDLHTAILYLSAPAKSSPEIQQVLEILTGIHRRVSDLIRSSPAGMQSRLSQTGFANLLKTTIENDFQNDFDSIRLSFEEDAIQTATHIPLFISEVIFFACRELIRNAAQHGRGKSLKSLNLVVVMKVEQEYFQICVEDNGVGINTSENRPLPGDNTYPILETSLVSQKGTGSGLRFHSAMLAAVGARLEIAATMQGGTLATIKFPIDGMDFSNNGVANNS